MAPNWMATTYVLTASSPALPFSSGKFRRRAATRRCPVDEIGRYSESPSTMPRIAASHQVSRSSVEVAAA